MIKLGGEDEEGEVELFNLHLNIYKVKNCSFGHSLEVQWLGLHTFTAEGRGSIPGRGTKISQAMQRNQKKNTAFFFSFYSTCMRK